MAIYEKYVKKRIPTFNPRRWIIKYEMLKTFVKLYEDISTFFEFCRNQGKPIQNELSRKDSELAELLLDIISPFDSFTKCVSSNKSLSPVYIRILVFLRKTIKESNDKLKKMGDTISDFSPAINLVDKYLKQAKYNFPLLYTCSSFCPFEDDVSDYSISQFDEKLEPANDFTEIAIKLCQFDFEKSATPGKKSKYGYMWERKYLNGIEHT
ncbi:hypothetical protein Kpol_526p2 [Vanderwaltozyma polyspora DSM 70294]|uniref:Uncharacterized protein n=1 Tax=Vanderwaltozyma polyspora (strain ATCC 22028 / DSM 70294 / BCRC 21397 / CBS 2163 / NBRC 10782 / NRRL Y-8283 / UCD 57-17) TaxID=436907 RepID=A7TLQ8_VANPO|nr:uncharacterized protein Kpol_526p2 [Vanderwaltozyma polyspora DSM 70294]EDO16750.1 hypothetical protein Kpol_526p2 [Vanderwaltozyma polyspora DSM 70294]